jgi:hypothetical protein
MSVAEVIEQLKKLSPEERREVVEHLCREENATLRDAAVSGTQPTYADQGTFERVKQWALDEHRELLSRLAK